MVGPVLRTEHRFFALFDTPHQAQDLFGRKIAIEDASNLLTSTVSYSCSTAIAPASNKWSANEYLLKFLHRVVWELDGESGLGVTILRKHCWPQPPSSTDLFVRNTSSESSPSLANTLAGTTPTELHPHTPFPLQLPPIDAATRLSKPASPLVPRLPSLPSVSLPSQRTPGPRLSLPISLEHRENTQPTKPSRKRASSEDESRPDEVRRSNTPSKRPRFSLNSKSSFRKRRAYNPTKPLPPRAPDEAIGSGLDVETMVSRMSRDELRSELIQSPTPPNSEILNMLRGRPERSFAKRESIPSSVDESDRMETDVSPTGTAPNQPRSSTPVPLQPASIETAAHRRRDTLYPSVTKPPSSSLSTQRTQGSRLSFPIDLERHENIQPKTLLRKRASSDDESQTNRARHSIPSKKPRTSLESAPRKRRMYNLKKPLPRLSLDEAARISLDMKALHTKLISRFDARPPPRPELILPPPPPNPAILDMLRGRPERTYTKQDSPPSADEGNRREYEGRVLSNRFKKHGIPLTFGDHHREARAPRKSAPIAAAPRSISDTYDRLRAHRLSTHMPETASSSQLVSTLETSEAVSSVRRRHLTIHAVDNPSFESFIVTAEGCMDILQVGYHACNQNELRDLTSAPHYRHLIPKTKLEPPPGTSTFESFKMPVPKSLEASQTPRGELREIEVVVEHDEDKGVYRVTVPLGQGALIVPFAKCAVEVAVLSKEGDEGRAGTGREGGGVQPGFFAVPDYFRHRSSRP